MRQSTTDRCRHSSLWPWIVSMYVQLGVPLRTSDPKTAEDDRAHRRSGTPSMTRTTDSVTISNVHTPHCCIKQCGLGTVDVENTRRHTLLRLCASKNWYAGQNRKNGSRLGRQKSIQLCSTGPLALGSGRAPGVYIQSWGSIGAPGPTELGTPGSKTTLTPTRPPRDAAR